LATAPNSRAAEVAGKKSHPQELKWSAAVANLLNASGQTDDPVPACPGGTLVKFLLA
jgi:hypothetical protein